jgi:hypothetical protein
MKNRTINELLIALKEEFNSYSYPGLCIAINHYSLFNAEEKKMLYSYLKKHAPWNKHTFLHLITFDNVIDAYMWDSRDTISRNKWLDKHIKKTKS